MNPNLKIIEEACKRANTKKKWRYTCDHCQCGTIIEEPVRIADVLLATGKTQLGFGWVCKPLNDKLFFHEKGPYWNLLDDNLSHQTPETWNFIAGILQ